LSALSLAPSLTAEEVETLFNSHLQDVLMVVYLANTVRTQMHISSKLNSM